jgi:hypothetical protein
MAREKENRMSQQVEVEKGTSAVALAGVIAPSTNTAWELISVTVNFDTAPTTSENLTLTLNSGQGSDYDTVIRSTDPSVGSATAVEFLLNERFASGDSIDLAYTNTDTRTIFWSARFDTSPNE